ncbi:hypothetical protein ACWEKR_34215 [Nocardia sp. NPDC004573]
MEAKSTVAVVGIAAGLIVGVSGVADAEPHGTPELYPGYGTYIGTYRSLEECYFAAADEIGRHPDKPNYKCTNGPTGFTLRVW